MIKAIIFDCFGVLAVDSWLPFKEERFGHNPKLFREAGDLNKQCDTGLISYDDFIIRIAKLAEIPTEQVREIIDDSPANKPLFTYIEQELKPAFKIGLLSNAGANWLDELFKPEQTQLFDAIALSFETGFIKPDPRAYIIIAQRLHVIPEECVLIDDQVRYCHGAKEAGMEFIEYNSFKQMKLELEQILSHS